MFESICIRRQLPPYATLPFDLGFLAEALLFYGEVRLIADRQILELLVSQGGPDTVLALMDEGFLKVTYTETLPAIRNERSGTPYEQHQPTTIGAPLPGTVPSGTNVPKLRLQDVAPEVFTTVTGKTGRGKRLAKRFVQHAETFSYGQEFIDQGTDDLSDAWYVSQAVRNLLSEIAPDYHLPPDFQFTARREGNWITVDTNLDFREIDRIIDHVTQKTGSALNRGSLLLYILEARADLYFSSRYAAEIATNPAYSAVISTKYATLMKGRRQSADNIADYQEMVLANAHSLRDVINAGERSLSEVISLLHSAQRFRRWLSRQEPTESLLHTYYDEVTKSTWIDKLPVKTLRWVLPLALGTLGFVNPVAGIAGALAGGIISAGDMFLLEKLAQGWRPNQFEGSLKQFTQSSK